MFGHYNQGYASSLSKSSLSGGNHLNVLKPEEFLNTVQPDESCSLQQYAARGLCGKYTKLVTIVLIVMALAVVGLAAALTINVLFPEDSDSASLGGFRKYFILSCIRLYKVSDNCIDFEANVLVNII